MSIYSGKDPMWVARRGTVSNGLVGHWDSMAMSAADRLGTRWLDLSGNNNHGTLVGGAAFDRIGCRYVNASDSVTVLHSNILMPTTAISLGVWVKFNISLASQIDYINLFAKENYFTENGYYLAFRTDQPQNWLTLRINGSSTVSTTNWDATTFFDDMRWHQIFATYDQLTIRLFVDGVQRATGSYSAPIVSNTNNIGLGGKGNWTCDDFRIYNRALSAAEISRNFNATRARFGV